MSILSLCAPVRHSSRAGSDPVLGETGKPLANARAAVSDPLSRQERPVIQNGDGNRRRIKGQVFLWKKGQDREDCGDLKDWTTP